MFGEAEQDPNNPRVFTFPRKEQPPTQEIETPPKQSLASKITKTLGAIALGATLYFSCTQDTPNHNTQRSPLVGQPVPGMMQKFTGQQPLYTEEAPDLESTLNDLWQEKRRNSTNTAAVDHVITNQVESYNQDTATKQTIDTYLDELQDEFQTLTQKTDWDSFQNIHNIDRDQTKTVQTVLSKVTGETLGSYVLTELLGGNTLQDAEENVEELDYLLQHGGTEYISLIPALHDPYLSFGQFQHTSYVVGDYGDVKGDATMNNEALPPKAQIPTSMKYMETQDHLPAAYSLLATGLARITRANPTHHDQLRTLSAQDIALIAASNHHNPSTTRREITQALTTGHSVPNALKSEGHYVKRTRQNYEALTNNETYKPRQPFIPAGNLDDWKLYEWQGQTDVNTAVQAFEEWDRARGDKYRDVGNLNAVQRDGELYDGQGTIYIKAKTPAP